MRRASTKIHVMPLQSGRGWSVRNISGKAGAVYETKSEAVIAARKITGQAGGVIITYGKNNQIQDVSVYRPSGSTFPLASQRAPVRRRYSDKRVLKAIAYARNGA